MALIPSVDEKQVNGTFVRLTRVDEHLGSGLTGPLKISDVGDPSTILTPLGPVISGTMPSRTSATITLTAPDNTGRPTITEYRVTRTGVGVVGVVTPGINMTFTESGLPVATPEVIHRYTAVAVNADGVGDVSNEVVLQWNGPAQNPPTAPSLLDRSNLTSTQVDLSWSETSDSTVDKHGIYENTGTLIKDNLDPAATTYTWTGLTPGSRHSNVNVRRHNAFGWSPASNLITFTANTSTVVHDVVMGIPLNDEYDAGRTFYTSWPATRTYSIAQAIGDFNSSGCRVIGLTFGPQDSNSATPTGGAAAAAELQSGLEEFYYTGAGAANRQNVEIHFATDNETDRNHTSGNLPAAYIDTVRLCHDVIHRLVGGVRRYPKASMWVDMTQNNIRNHGAGPRFKAIAQYLDGFACSMYPPGRDLSKNQPNSPVFSTYSSYCDEVFATVADWRATGGPGWSYATPNAGASLVGQLDQFATWEFGIPIDHAQNPAGGDTPGNTQPNEGEPSASTNFTIRPRYCAGGVDSTGKDWKGFLQYTHDALDAIGVIMREQIYWNQQSNADMPNQMWHDAQPRANPDTEHAWHNWTPGTRLPNG